MTVTNRVSSDSSGDSASGDNIRRWLWILGSVTAVIVPAAVLWRMGAGMGFHADEWLFVTERHEVAWRTFVAPHNGHLSFLPASFYLLGFHTVGLDGYEFYRLGVLILHLAIAAVVAVRVRRRHGTVPAWAAWFTVVLMGAGTQNIFWGFQVGFLGSALAFIVAIEQLERFDATACRHHLALAATSLVIAVLCSGLGVAAVATVATLTIAHPKRHLMWWVALPAVAVYGAWYVAYGESQQVSPRLADIASWILESAAWTVASLFGLGIGWGYAGVAILAGLAVAGAGLSTLRRRWPIQPLLFAGPFFAVAFLTLTAISREGINPASSRYMYVLIVMLIMSVGDLTPRATSPNSRAIVGLATAAAATMGVWGTSDDLVAGRNFHRAWGLSGSTQLSVIEQHPDAFADDLGIEPIGDRPLLVIGNYREAVRVLGSTAAYDPRRIHLLDDRLPAAAETRLLQARLLELSPSESDRFRCTTVAEEELEWSLEAGGHLSVEASAETEMVVSRLRAPPSNRHAPDEVIGPGTVVIEAPFDEFEVPWRLSFSEPVDIIRCPAADDLPGETGERALD